MAHKRNRDSLTPNAHELRERRHSSPKKSYLVARARDDSKETFISNQNRSMIALNAQYSIMTDSGDDENLTENQLNFGTTNSPDKRLSKNQSFERKIAIKYVYEYIYGSVPPDSWEQLSLVTSISKRLNIPHGSYAEVKKVLHDIAASTENNESYDPKGGERKRGRSAILIDEWRYRRLFTSWMTSAQRSAMAMAMIIEYHLLSANMCE
jgi:hypothetical protein